MDPALLLTTYRGSRPHPGGVRRQEDGGVADPTGQNLVTNVGKSPRAEPAHVKGEGEGMRCDHRISMAGDGRLAGRTPSRSMALLLAGRHLSCSRFPLPATEADVHEPHSNLWLPTAAGGPREGDPPTRKIESRWRQARAALKEDPSFVYLITPQSRTDVRARHAARCRGLCRAAESSHL
jgi:hypothetical protein